MTRFALLGVLDFFNQEMRIFLDRARFKLRFLLVQAERERRVHPVDEAGVIWFIDIEILLHFRRHGGESRGGERDGQRSAV